MKKILKYVFILFLLLPLNVKAITEEYIIDKYDVNINVKDNNVIEVEEIINVNYIIPSHGIVREIPLENKFYNSNNKTIITNSKFEMLNCNEQYKLSKKNNIVSIKLGSKDKVIQGNKNYIIKYNLDVGEQHLNEYDLLYFNIIGNKWDTNINDVSFKINMPKEFDNSKLKFNCINEVKYNISNNTIFGYINKSNNIALSKNQGLSIELKLDKDYFQNERKTINKAPFKSSISFIKNNIIFIVSNIFCLVIILIGIILYFKNFYYSKKLIIPELSIPEEDSAQIGFLYKRKTNKKQIISLILYCVNKGYFKLHNDNKKLYVEKIRDFAKNEKLYIQCAFFDSFDDSNIVEIDNFKINLQTSICALESYYNYNEKNLDDKIKISGLLLYLNFILMLGLSISIKNIIVMILMIVLGLLSLIIGALIRNLPKKFEDKEYNMYLKTLGLKKYLETVEKEKIELLVNDNPDYFYKILPYAYVLDVSDTWMKKFNKVELEQLSLLDILNIEKNIIEEKDNYKLESFYNEMVSNLKDNSVSANSTISHDSSSSISNGSGGGGGYRW